MLAVKVTCFAGRSLRSRTLTAPRGSGFRPSMALLRKADSRVGFCQQKPRKAQSHIGSAVSPGGAERREAAPKALKTGGPMWPSELRACRSPRGGGSHLRACPSHDGTTALCQYLRYPSGHPDLAVVVRVA